MKYFVPVPFPCSTFLFPTSFRHPRKTCSRRVGGNSLIKKSIVGLIRRRAKADSPLSLSLSVNGDDDDEASVVAVWSERILETIDGGMTARFDLRSRSRIDLVVEC